MTWTRFWDMHSGGSTKEEPYNMIFIEAPEDEAKVIFYNRFGHNPERVTCSCCGDDYSISEGESLKQLTGYHRGCRNLVTPRGKDGLYKNDDPIIRKHLYLEEDEKPPKGYEVETDSFKMNNYQTLDEYIKKKDVLVIYSKDIKDAERKGEVPQQGWVYVD